LVLDQKERYLNCGYAWLMSASTSAGPAHPRWKRRLLFGGLLLFLVAIAVRPPTSADARIILESEGYEEVVLSGALGTYEFTSVRGDMACSGALTVGSSVWRQDRSVEVDCKQQRGL
jgi:hypothetical protein